MGSERSEVSLRPPPSVTIWGARSRRTGAAARYRRQKFEPYSRGPETLGRRKGAGAIGGATKTPVGRRNQRSRESSAAFGHPSTTPGGIKSQGTTGAAKQRVGRSFISCPLDPGPSAPQQKGRRNLGLPNRGPSRRKDASLGGEEDAISLPANALWSIGSRITRGPLRGASEVD